MVSGCVPNVGAWGGREAAGGSNSNSGNTKTAMAAATTAAAASVKNFGDLLAL